MPGGCRPQVWDRPAGSDKPAGVTNEPALEAGEGRFEVKLQAEYSRAAGERLIGAYGSARKVYGLLRQIDAIAVPMQELIAAKSRERHDRRPSDVSSMGAKPISSNPME
jgi:hypothetical protein